MTIFEELHTLYRLFPHSEELAVTRDMAIRYEKEIVSQMRFASTDVIVILGSAWEDHDRIRVKRLPLWYRDRRLILVESRS